MRIQTREKDNYHDTGQLGLCTSLKKINVAEKNYYDGQAGLRLQFRK